jgi:hypothetical protein
MKKWFFLILFLTLVISGCQTNGQSNNNPDYEPESGDIVDKHGNISNLDNFNMFVDHIKQGEKDKIRIVHYTKEGDAILYDLDFDGKTIHSTLDSTRDEYGSGSITNARCKSIAVIETNTILEYVLEECDSNEREFSVLTIEEN